MINVKINTKTYDIELYDNDFETFQGQQFKQYIFNIMRKELNSLRQLDIKDKTVLFNRLNNIFNIMNNYGFKCINSTVVDGNIINEYDYIGEQC